MKTNKQIAEQITEQLKQEIEKIFNEKYCNKKKADFFNCLLLKHEVRSLIKKYGLENYYVVVRPGEKRGQVCVDIQEIPNE